MVEKNKLQTHIFKGIGRTIPVIILYSLVLAMGEWNVLFVDASDYIFMSIVPILALNIVYSMHRFSYLLPVAFVGYIAYLGGIGILGGIIVGILFGVSITYIKDIIFKSENIMLPYIILINFVLGGLFYLVIQFIVVPPFAYALDYIFGYLQSIDKTNVMFLVGILSFFTVIDLGGPLNKVAFAFNIESFLNGYYNIVGPVIISVTVPALSIYLAMLLYKNRFSDEDRTQKKFAMLSSIFGMTEGAMAIGFRRIRIIPVLIVGSMLGTLFAAYFGLESNMLLAAVPGLLGTSNIVVYLTAHAIGVGVILLMIPLVLKKEELNIIDN